jgi:drug/metabolite transporter (DMT)-like permease
MPTLSLALIAVSAFLHAGWNLLAHRRRSDGALFLRVTLVTGLAGLVPALIAELQGPRFPPEVWGLLAITGLFQSLYYLGLTMGYRSGHFTVVYPVARALPVLFLAFIDLARGHAPSPLGWAGMLLVVAGCAIAPLESLRTVTASRYLNRTTIWIVITALGTVGYSTIDKIAAELMAPGPLSAARYGVLESLFTVPYIWLALKLVREPLRGKNGLADWKWPTLAAIFIFAAYWLVLWAYQLSPFASYIVALRQFSIVIGVTAAAVLLKEPARLLRLGAAVLIALGIICISLAS